MNMTEKNALVKRLRRLGWVDIDVWRYEGKTARQDSYQVNASKPGIGRRRNIPARYGIRR